MIGTKLGHYEITSHLGTGGMGEVYQATDSKLVRSVAIKLLPEAFTHDADRAARFEREARVLASLNHPHIAAIYGLEESDSRKFLVMELAGGETLAERIARGPLPMDEALRIAAQIAEAIESAHEKGVIHRDLKPANIKVTADGQVKVLDFGLAKAFASEALEANLSNSPTLSMAATNAGMIMGTAAYMSPEQAKAQEVDRRTDLFSFGAVLYEMLTGRQAFPGGTVSEILAGVLKVDPDWSRLPKDTPAGIRRLLERSLRKDRNRRLQTATDALIEIEEETAKPERAGHVASATAAAAPRKRERLAWIAALAVAVAITTVAMLYFRPLADAPETRLDIVTPATTSVVSFVSFDVSPDGRRLVFVASGDGASRLWLRPLDSTTAQPLPGTEGAIFPFWSPDSKSVGFFAAGKLKLVDIGGGLPRTLTDSEGGGGGTWSQEGVIVFAPTTTGPLFRIPAQGGKTVAITKDDPPRQTNHRFPQFLPGGRQFLFYVRGTADAEGIYLGSLDSPEAKFLTDADASGLYVPSGWLLYIRQGTLAARRLDAARGELTGDPVTVANPVTLIPSGTVGTGGKGAFAVSAAGIIAYRAGSSGVRQLTWFDRSGKMLGTLGGPDDNNLLEPEISPDGRRVAVRRTVQGNDDIWLMDEFRSTRFTFAPNTDSFPLWSPDGMRISFDRNGDIYVKPSNGAGSEELLIESPTTKINSDWSPDGRVMLVNTNGNQDLQVLPLDGDRKLQPFLHSDVGTKTNNRFSPDGRWVSYQSNESGQQEIYVRPYPGPGGVWQISLGGGIAARWRPDGKELYYIARDGKMMAAPIAVQGNTLVPGTPVALFQTRIAVGARSQYDVAPDGRFLINVALDETLPPIRLLQNWNPLGK